ncbi:hypothetical protein D3C80_1639520 [compost metagenome]
MLGIAVERVEHQHPAAVDRLQGPALVLAILEGAFFMGRQRATEAPGHAGGIVLAAVQGEQQGRLSSHGRVLLDIV